MSIIHSIHLHNLDIYVDEDRLSSGPHESFLVVLLDIDIVSSSAFHDHRVSTLISLQSVYYNFPEQFHRIKLFYSTPSSPLSFQWAPPLALSLSIHSGHIPSQVAAPKQSAQLGSFAWSLRRQHLVTGPRILVAAKLPERSVHHI